MDRGRNDSLLEERVASYVGLSHGFISCGSFISVQQVMWRTQETGRGIPELLCSPLRWAMFHHLQRLLSLSPLSAGSCFRPLLQVACSLCSGRVKQCSCAPGIVGPRRFSLLAGALISFANPLPTAATRGM